MYLVFYTSQYLCINVSCIQQLTLPNRSSKCKFHFYSVVRDFNIFAKHTQLNSYGLSHVCCDSTVITKSESLFAKLVLFYQSLKDNGGKSSRENRCSFPNDITVTIKNVNKQIIQLTKYKKELYPSAFIEQHVLINNQCVIYAGHCAKCFFCIFQKQHSPVVNALELIAWVPILTPLF